MVKQEPTKAPITNESAGFGSQYLLEFQSSQWLFESAMHSCGEEGFSVHSSR